MLLYTYSMRSAGMEKFTSIMRYQASPDKYLAHNRQFHLNFHGVTRKGLLLVDFYGVRMEYNSKTYHVDSFPSMSSILFPGISAVATDGIYPSARIDGVLVSDICNAIATGEVAGVVKDMNEYKILVNSF